MCNASSIGDMSLHMWHTCSNRNVQCSLSLSLSLYFTHEEQTINNDFTKISLLLLLLLLFFFFCFFFTSDVTSHSFTLVTCPSACSMLLTMIARETTMCTFCGAGKLYRSTNNWWKEGKRGRKRGTQCLAHCLKYNCETPPERERVGESGESVWSSARPQYTRNTAVEASGRAGKCLHLHSCCVVVPLK